MVLVELYADGVGGGPSIRQKLDLHSPAAPGGGMTVFGGRVPATRSAADFTPRVMPHLDGALVPLETAQILWQR